MCWYEQCEWACGFLSIRYPRDGNGNERRQACPLYESNMIALIAPHQCPHAACCAMYRFHDNCYRCQITSEAAGDLIGWVCELCGTLNDVGATECSRDPDTASHHENHTPRKGDYPWTPRADWVTVPYTKCGKAAPREGSTYFRLITDNHFGPYTRHD